MTTWIVVTVVSKSATSCEIDTFITDWSRTIRNCAAARTESPHLPATSTAAADGTGSGSRIIGNEAISPITAATSGTSSANCRASGLASSLMRRISSCVAAG